MRARGQIEPNAISPTLVVFYSILLGLIASGVAAAENKKIYTFGVVPQQSATVLAGIWGPVIQAIGDSAGVDLKFATTKDIPTFEACLANGVYDFVYMNPYHYVSFNAQTGYRAFAREKDINLVGIIVANRASNVASISDLQGATLAFPSPAAFAASIIPRAELARSGIKISASYVKSHDSVYLAVQHGLFPAGGGVRRTFENMPEEVKEGLKVIFETEPYPAHAFAAHPSVEQGLVSLVANAMTMLSDSVFLDPIGVKGFVAAVDDDWASIRALNLKPEESGIVIGENSNCPSG